MGPGQDLALVILTPLLIVPLVALLQLGVGISKIALLVAAFGALGHHLPGMMRAYGDRGLFARFKVRFIAAPIFLVSVCVFFSLRDLAGLTVIALVWGVWHGMAQLYGFARIYDAKIGAASSVDSRIDLALCTAWFGAGILFSPERTGDLLQKFYDCGGPLIPVAAFRSFQGSWALATGIATVSFFANALVGWRHGRTPSIHKLLLLASGLGFWWYAMVGIQNAILGIAIYEIFHDAQYNTIVWSFNRRVIEKGGTVGGFTRFLFRRGGGMIYLYVGLIFAYGSIALVNEAYFSGTLHRVLLGLIVASGLLHFYYDGFIWKVRDRSIKAGLDVAGGSLRPEGDGHPGWIQHALAWSVFVVPTLLLAAGQTFAPHESKLEGFQRISEIVPDDYRNRLRLGSALLSRNRFEEAALHVEHVIALRPDDALAYLELGNVRAAQQDEAAAISAYRRAVELDPSNAQAALELGRALTEAGQYAAAEEIYERVLELVPASYEANTNLGAVYQARGDLERARARYERAIEVDPGAAAAYYNLGLLLEDQGNLREAAAHFRNALRVDPSATAAREDLRRIESRL